MKPHVLVVDDSLTVRMDLRAVLSAAGFSVTACENKTSAQKALRTRSFALVILDVVLPDGSGIDLLREIRGEQASVHVPVILLSTEAEVKHRVRGLTTGADEYVGKPYDSAYVTRCARELTRAHNESPEPSGSVSLGKKILVVDDSPTYLQTLADLLRQDGHDVVLARCGEEALELLAVEVVDGVILDLLMPGIGGLETCRRIRSDAALQHIPIMMLTGRDDAEARKAGLLAGVDEFVIKSPELELLRVRLRGLLRKKRLEQLAGSDGSPPSEARSAPSSRNRTASLAPPAARPSRRSISPTSMRTVHPPNDEPKPSSPRGKRADAAEGESIKTLFDRVISLCGLPFVIGPSTLERACRRAGVDAKTMSLGDLRRALPEIRDTLALFLPRDEAERRAEALASLAGSPRLSP
ncbi:MAG: response regulator [Polyangiaceae bacterium]|nr:response regulator [Polyangiaceae bacterium]